MTDEQIEEQTVTMSDSIRKIEGIGKQAIEVFELAGFLTIGQLKNFNAQDRLLWDAIQNIKKTRTHLPDSCWKRLMTRCINIVYRARSAQADEFIPAEYMCPLTLDWFQDPVVVSSGQSYSREALLEYLQGASIDPVTREDIGKSPMFVNNALCSAVDHYRLNHQRFRILL